MKPVLIDVLAKVKCECGEVTEFDELGDGWTHIWPCDYCGRRIQIDVSTYLTYDSQEQT